MGCFPAVCPQVRIATEKIPLLGKSFFFAILTWGLGCLLACLPGWLLACLLAGLPARLLAYPSLPHLGQDSKKKKHYLGWLDLGQDSKKKTDSDLSG